jgi:hypothetical protein
MNLIKQSSDSDDKAPWPYDLGLPARFAKYALDSSLSEELMREVRTVQLIVSELLDGTVEKTVARLTEINNMGSKQLNETDHKKIVQLMEEYRSTIVSKLDPSIPFRFADHQEKIRTMIDMERLDANDEDSCISGLFEDVNRIFG